MANLQLRWKGSATAATGVATLTVGGSPSTAQTFKTTLTDEQGTAMTLTTTGGSTNRATVATTIYNHITGAAGAATFSSVYSHMTWAVTSAVITATATLSGRPFYLTAATTGTSGTYTRSNTTSSKGPNDWLTSTNWESTSGVAKRPTSTDKVYFLEGNIPVKYGLNPGLGGALTELNIGQNYTGSIGGYQATGSQTPHYLIVGATTVRHAGMGQEVWLNGTLTSVYPQGGRGSKDWLHMKGTITTLHANDPNINGTITTDSGASVGTVYLNDCPGANVVIKGGGGTITLAAATAGRLTFEKIATTVRIAGNAIVTRSTSTATVTTLNMHGGTYYEESGATITTFNHDAGLVDASRVKRVGPTYTNYVQRGGTLITARGLSAVTFSNKVVVHGGRIIPDATGHTIGLED